ncbi:hypothetical protein [Enteractinococcus helveticum]|uniref:Uncharacterized protein n=1 Tax=Enteractinococcus helveticum TaxID=1837282 RepID=A0A1B7LYK9_9MICC|nr:hypothetical protein [Enteractinococcus helveticum]OAV60472.1 hypothetical protein A6F49_10880 [Enteractinococcus helveticum]
MTTAVPEEVRRAALLRTAQQIDYLDYRRTLRVIKAKGYSQRTVAQGLNISQPALSQQFKGVDEVAEPQPGFSGAGPYEICQRYAIGQLSRAELIDELIRWPYAPSDTTDGVDTLLIDPPGSWDEVEQACDRGLIDGQIYDEVLDRIAID